MSATWYLVQYTHDLNRREPRNVGVLLHAPGGWLSKFLGETSTGDIRGTAIRHLHGSVEVYRSWVEYFRRKVASDDWASIDRIQGGRQRNYAARLGGTILDPGGHTWHQTLERLYQDMVGAEPAPPVRGGRTSHLLDATERVLAESGITPERSVRVPALFDKGGQITHVPFRYSYVNGQVHLMDLVQSHVTPEQAGADARELRARVDATRRAKSANSFVVFYASSLLREDYADQVLLPIEDESHTVDVDNENEAIDAMRTLMGH